MFSQRKDPRHRRLHELPYLLIIVVTRHPDLILQWVRLLVLKMFKWLFRDDLHQPGIVAPRQTLQLANPYMARRRSRFFPLIHEPRCLLALERC